MTLASIIISGLVLYSFGEISYSAGFCLLFGSAALARFASGYFISRMDEPPHRSDPASDFTFLMFIARFRQSNFLKVRGLQRLPDVCDLLSGAVFRRLHAARPAIQLS